ncbi:hypothetical protein SAMN05444161_5117 [Rhizobiales bacterium GAS191]|nr:hypothetical protein SAMN05444161_5117 [Rhizobiales bacterium GAS191]
MTRSGRPGAALFTLLLLFFLQGLGCASANPGCSLGDIGQAAKDTFTNIPASCAPQAADPAFYPVLGYIIALLQTPQGPAFCDAAENANASAMANAWKQLPDFIKVKLEPLLGDLSADASAALDVAACACKTAQWKGPGDLAGDFGACVSDALCSAQDWLHDNVSSDFSSCAGPPPQPPQLIDCRVDPCAAGLHACDTGVPIAGTYGVQCFSGDRGYVCQGSFCFSENLFSTGEGNYCFCPPAMQRHDGFIQDIEGNCAAYVLCACPADTQPLSATGAGAYICMCPDTGLPVNDDGSCPAPPPKCEPSCPAGFVSKISDKQSCTYSCECPDGLTKAGDKCVSPCADPSDVLLESGACCPAAQATSCGTCCPAGMVPDATGQSCVTKPKGKGPPKLPKQPLKRQ